MNGNKIVRSFRFRPELIEELAEQGKLYYNTDNLTLVVTNVIEEWLGRNQRRP